MEGMPPTICVMGIPYPYYQLHTHSSQVAASLMRELVRFLSSSIEWKNLPKDPKTANSIHKAYLAQHSNKRFLLVIDQFEELFTFADATMSESFFG